VTVQAVYDTESIALLVRWNDMSPEKTGTNAPSLPVPPEEEESGPGGAKPAGDSPFGDLEVAAEQPAADPFADAAAPAAVASEFSDAVAIQIPSAVPTGARKPYFIFGDGQSPVDLWFFDLARPEPLQYTGRGSADVTPNDTGEVTGVASYDQGEWSVVFKRPLRSTLGATFSPGRFMPIGFSVWDGFSRERGNRRGLTVWQSIYLQPDVVPSAVGPMVRTAMLILAIELAVIGWVRSRYAARARDEAGAERGQQPATSV
jgi:hypothetical protein